MKPNIIYGFDVNYLENSKLTNYLNMHSISSNLAKKLGYTTEIYTNSDIFDSYFDTIHKFDYNYIFWDSYKLLPYSLRDDDYMIIDYDLFIHKNISFDKDVDFYFDTWESWKYYDAPVKILTELGIGDVIPEWNSNKQKVMNTGILYFKNIDFRKLYYKRYIEFYQFCEQNLDALKTYKPFQMFGTIAAQYLLTILSTYYNIQHYNFSKIPREKNEYYHHMCGPDKFDVEFRIKKNIL